MPGLLQTEAYARAVIHATHPLDLPEEVDAKVRARMQRAKLFDDPKKPECWTILHESLLRGPDPLLPPVQMAEQLGRIVALARSRRVWPQVLPWNAPTRPFMALAFKFLEFEAEPSLMYTEGPYHRQTIDDPALVKQHRKAYDRLPGRCVGPLPHRRAGRLAPLSPG
ncbi:DUF5753 domain-containing protein [Streptomyces sp. NPDC020742]|uniref:DUF5753 domain-containing protein n=1 Tax=Streptomyces sp. NPDC020742 TaxID=3154897 RepID=UPI0034062FAB